MTIDEGVLSFPLINGFVHLISSESPFSAADHNTPVQVKHNSQLVNSLLIPIKPYLGHTSITTEFSISYKGKAKGSPVL